jgi:3-dehydroquinate synthase
MIDLPSNEFQNQIIVQTHSLDNLEKYLERFNYSKIVILTHPSLWVLYEQKISQQLTQLGWNFSVVLIPEGEASKSLKQATRCWQHLTTHQCDRHSLLIALGGGVICDLTGFVASCYMRGIKTIYLPTTLLAMVDASLGGKTGVNYRKQKNLIGTFHLTSQILIDPATLATLSARDYQAGFAEIIKYGMIASNSLFELLEHSDLSIIQRDEQFLETVIRQSCAIKQTYIQADFHDKGIRAHLNYGHTFGHAIETLTDYQYSHGEAVSIGMSCAAYLSYQMNLTSLETIQRQDALFQKMELPTQLSQLPIQRLLNLMKKDKKGQNGTINLILPEKIGKVSQFFNINPTLLKNILLAKTTK